MIRKIGKYWLTQRIGKGGMGEVWSAVHVEQEMPCAIKLLRADHRGDRDYLDMFLNEARICSQLRHGGIVKVHESGVDSRRPYIAMDLIDGVDLSTFVKTIRRSSDAFISPSLAAHIIGQVLEALDYAHSRTVDGREGGVIHGDVTPRNILISSHGEVLLTDFGLASFVSAASIRRNPVGTPAYMAPEQSVGCICRLSDLYSVGAVLHDMLADRPLRPRPCSFDDLRLHSDRDPPDLDREDVPTPLEELRRSLLQGHLDRRLPSARHGLDILRTWSEFRNQSRTLRKLYRCHIGPARSGLTSFLQASPEETSITPESNEVEQLAAPRTRTVKCLTELARVILDDDPYSAPPIDDPPHMVTRQSLQGVDMPPLPQTALDTPIKSRERRRCVFFGSHAISSLHRDATAPLLRSRSTILPTTTPLERRTQRLSRLDPSMARSN